MNQANEKLRVVGVDSAKLPINYIKARIAIQECASVDECKNWGDKAEAIASYAKQIKDDSLLLTAKRIKLRATRRMGELLQELPRGSTGIEKLKRKVDSTTASAIRTNADGLTSTELARKYGVSKHLVSRISSGETWSRPTPSINRTTVSQKAGLDKEQVSFAIGLARMPLPDFETVVESSTPPPAHKCYRGAFVHKAMYLTPESIQLVQAYYKQNTSEWGSVGDVWREAIRLGIAQLP